MAGPEDLSLLQGLLAARTGGGDPAALLADSDDPRMKLFAQLLARRQEAAAQAEGAGAEAEESAPRFAVETIEMEPEPAGPSPAELRLRRRLAMAEEEIARLEEVNDLLAAALGACERCWGEDRRCPRCRGRGRPGARRPDPDLFARLVVPAVERVRRARKTAAGPPVRPPAADLTPIFDRTTTPERR